MNPANILALLSVAAQLAPTVESLLNAAKLAISEGRDATPAELAAAVADDTAASDALDKWLES
jgi:hypothetical protein